MKMPPLDRVSRLSHARMSVANFFLSADELRGEANCRVGRLRGRSCSMEFGPRSKSARRWLRFDLFYGQELTGVFPLYVRAD